MVVPGQIGGGVDGQPSLEAFVAARGEALVRFAFVLCGDHHRARDLVQVALVKVLRRWDRICAGGDAEAYLHRVIVTQYASMRRRRSWTEQPIAEPRSDAVSDPFAAIDDRDFVWRFLGHVPRRQRAVLILRYLEDWSDAQIADALGCSEATIRSQASRALNALRMELNDGTPRSIPGVPQEGRQ